MDIAFKYCGSLMEVFEYTVPPYGDIKKREALMKAMAGFLAAAAVAILAAGAGAQVPAGGEEPVYTELPGQGKMCRIGEEFTFTYEFDKTPKMGMIVVKIKLFDKSGARTTEMGDLRTGGYAYDARRP